MESLGNVLLADIKEQAEGDRDVKVVAQHIGFNGSAKADSSFQVHKAFDEAAARRHRGLADGNVKEAAEQLGADAEFKSVPRALSMGRWRVWHCRRAWVGHGRGRDIAVAAG